MSDLTKADKLRMKMIYYVNAHMNKPLSQAKARHIVKVGRIADHIKDFALEDELKKLPKYIQKEVRETSLE